MPRWPKARWTAPPPQELLPKTSRVLQRGVRDLLPAPNIAPRIPSPPPLEGWLTAYTNNTFIVGTFKMQRKIGYTAVTLSLFSAASLGMLDRSRWRTEEITTMDRL